MPTEHPTSPWIQVIAEAHAAAQHTPGQPCGGSIDLITPETRLRGAAHIRSGRTVSLQKPVETRPDFLDGNHKNVELEVAVSEHGRFVSGGDVITIDAHGTGNTHLDSVAHMGLDGCWHNDVPAKSSYTTDAALVGWAQHGVVTRAILANIPALRGTEWVEIDQPVTGEEIEAAIAATGLTFEPGDALLLYMGRDRYEAAGNVYPTGRIQGSRPGIGQSGAEWIAAHGVSVLCWDFHDARADETGTLEVHMLIWATGLCIIDNCLLGPAAETLAADGVSAGLLNASPLAIYRSTGCLINPVLTY